MKTNLVIGVTGHRSLVDKIIIAELVTKAIREIPPIYDFSKLSDFSLEVISPLAEGADRIVVREILKQHGSSLKVVLPFAVEEYKKDFTSDESRNEFNFLLNQAKDNMIVLNKGFVDKEQQNNAYLECGKYVVDNCDILIAIWNEKPAAGVGGTGDIVRYARETKSELIIINPENHKIKTEGEFKDYCCELKNTVIDNSLLDKHYNDLFIDNNYDMSNDVLENVSPHFKEVILRKLLPDYVKADRLSLKNQLVFRKSMLVFWIAFIALALISMVTSFGYHEIPVELLGIELGVLVLTLIVYFFTNKRSHPGWIENRMIAEYIRILMFTSIFHSKGIINSIRIRRKYIWANRIIFLLMKKISPMAIESYTIATIKEFLVKWLSSQMEYHSANNIKHIKKDTRWKHVSIMCFVLAVIVAIIHLTIPTSSFIASLLIFLTFMLPAFVSTFDAYRYIRNDKAYSFNSKLMYSIIEGYKNQLTRCSTIAEIEIITEELGLIFINELERWYITAKSHEMELAL